MTNEQNKDDLQIITFNHILARFTHLTGFPSINVYPGWYKLIIDLDKALSYISPDYTIDQVKTKFAGLRYYANYVPKPDEADESTASYIFNKLIFSSERTSQMMCETCGEYGERVTINGWQFVGCNEHKDKHPTKYLD